MEQKQFYITNNCQQPHCVIIHSFLHARFYFLYILYVCLAGRYRPNIDGENAFFKDQSSGAFRRVSYYNIYS